MVSTSLDRIVRSVLLQKQLPLHYYLRFLKYGADSIRELSYDTIPNIFSTTLTLNSYYAVDLPCGFLDITKIGIPAGQYVKPIAQRDSANRQPNYTGSPNGLPVPYSSTLSLPVDIATVPFFGGFWAFPNIDDLGEAIGRMYGVNTGYNQAWYKLIPERNQIQFSERFPSTTIVLEWIGSGECANNATQVSPYSIKTIECYIDWMYKLHQRKPNLGEVETAKRLYGNELRKLRARMSNLDTVQIRQILQRSYQGSPKSS